jgi:hypothetical protein
MNSRRSAMHESVGRTGDRFKGRNKEQETRCRTVITNRRRSALHESRWDRRQVQGKGNEEHETRCKQKEEETRCRKGITTEDEVQCKKVGRRGDNCEGRNKERETRCRKGIMNKNAWKYREDRRQVLGKE